MTTWSTIKSRLTASALEFFGPAGTAILTIDSGGTVTAPTLATTTVSATAVGVSSLRLGAAETPTIASNVLAVTASHVNPLPESSTSDQVDSITKVGQAAGDLLLIHVPATNTITFDNSSTMLLGAGTRAVAPGGSLLLIAVSATVWHEVSFLAASS